MSKAEIARKCFSQGSVAPRPSSRVCRGVWGGSGDALRISAVFGGGIARTGGACGALSGALMVLGLEYGMAQPNPAIKERSYEIARQFVERFRAANVRSIAATC